MYLIIFIPCRDETCWVCVCVGVCVRAFVRGCTLREKTSPLDVPKTKRNELTSFLSQEGAGAAQAGPAGAGKAAGHPGQPHLCPQGQAGPGRAVHSSSNSSSRPVPATALAAHTPGQSRSREENRDNEPLCPDVRLLWPRDTRRGLGRVDFKEKGVVVYFLKSRKRWVKMRRPRFPWQTAGQEPNPLETRSTRCKGSTAPAQSFSKATNWKDIKASRQHNTNRKASDIHSPRPLPFTKNININKSATH